MRDYITIGSSPVSEPCAQVGSANYGSQSRRECRAFLAQLRRHFGDEVGSALLGIKTFPHDFGLYREVICYYDDDDEEGREYAYSLESSTPEYWDEEAKEELEKAEKEG